MGEIAPGVSIGAKMFFLGGRGNSGQNSTIFDTTVVNQCPCGNRHEKFPNFCTGSFAGCKDAIFGSFLMWSACTEHTAEMPKFCATG